MKNNNDKKNNHVQKDLITEFFKKNPNRDIKHPEVVDWVAATYKKRTGNIFRDPDRAIRQLAQSGFLIKIRVGKSQSARILQKLRKILAGNITQQLFGMRETYPAAPPGVHLCLLLLLMSSLR